MLRDTPSSSKEWTLGELDDAYEQGLYAGLHSQPEHHVFYYNDVMAAGWLAGWEDGARLLKQHHRQRQRERGTVLMTLHLNLPRRRGKPLRRCLAKPDYSH